MSDTRSKQLHLIDGDDDEDRSMSGPQPSSTIQVML
jgi:hypothetical protein